ncbi:hypothetical protein BHM03_00013024, partial [Ensete ventricosum]
IMATRAQEIARCREEMLGMAHGMPESAYELTPRDMVESPRPKIEKHDQERPVEGEMSSEKKDVEEPFHDGCGCGVCGTGDERYVDRPGLGDQHRVVRRYQYGSWVRFFACSFPLNSFILEEFVHFILQAVGVEFPPRTENTVPLFTPPQTHPIAYQPATSVYDDAALEASLQSDVSALRLLLQIFLNLLSSCSLQDIQSARGIADVLSEILNALDPNNRERVLQRHDDILKGTAPSGGAPLASAVPLVNNVNHEDDELEDDLSQLSLSCVELYNPFRTVVLVTYLFQAIPHVMYSAYHVIFGHCYRTSKDTATGQSRKASSVKNPSPFLPPPAPSRPISTEANTVDYLSGDVFRSEQQLDAPLGAPLPPTLSPRSSPGSSDSAPTLKSSEPPRYDEPLQAAKSGEKQLPKAPWELQQPSGLIPPPPSKYGQRQQFFEHQKHGYSDGNSISPYDGFVAEDKDFNYLQQHDQQHLGGLDSSPPAQQAKPEDMLFKDLVDFAKAKSSPSTTLPNNRSTR